MYTDTDTELRDFVVENLEANGFLKKIKAQIRAGVFLALEENDKNFKSKVPLFNKKLEDFIGTPEGKLACSVVREFLEYFHLDFTLSVYDPEVALPKESLYLNRYKICEKLKCSADFDGPIISALLKSEPSKAKMKNYSKSLEDQISSPSILSNLLGSNTNNIENLRLSKSKDDGDVTLSSLKFNPKTADIATSSRKPTLDAMPQIAAEDKTADVASMNRKPTLDAQPQIDKIEKSKKSIHAENVSSNEGSQDDDFFDAPVPSEKQTYVQGFLGLSNGSGDKSASNKNPPETKETPEASSLTSLKDLPSLTGNTPSWNFGQQPNIAGKKPSFSKPSIDVNLAKDVDPESTEESSDKQLNSEESIEEDIEEDFSGGADDLLNSNLSMTDDVTSDHSISQASAVDGVDHIEKCLSN